MNKNKVIGILAHVDAGKTTFSEQVLYHTKSIRNRGRVDYKTAFLDSDEIEKDRGITIFSEQAVFLYEKSRYYLIDTPGHVDFSTEMERAIAVMDYAVLLLSCIEGVQSHTETVFELLKKYKVPVFFFLNKTDRENAEPDRVIEEIKQKLTNGVCNFQEGFQNQSFDIGLMEKLAEFDEELLELYLDGKNEQTLWLEKVKDLIQRQILFPCFQGSALLDIGITEFLQSLEQLTFSARKNNEEEFSGRVYKVRYDKKGNRLVFFKVISGSLDVKSEVAYLSKQTNQVEYEKINEIRVYHGEKFKNVERVDTGELCAVLGLSKVIAGDGIGKELERIQYETTPILTAKVIYDKKFSSKMIVEKFQILEQEDPMLFVIWNESLQEIHIHIMGSIQLEVLQKIVKKRFDIEVSFGKCEILYKETIENTVIGYGHFEPLRHYAEVHLRLSRGKRNSGITFSSECSKDCLESQYQNLIQTHIFEKVHKGILIGAELTDIEITLVTGRAHIKHTEGGDFREATYRAIRQGLEHAKNIILEPYYAFRIEVPTENLGRALSDIQKLSGSFESPQMWNTKARIIGTAPVATFLDYAKEIVSYTKGRGSMIVKFDGYRPCHNPEEVIKRIAYDKEKDLENVSYSVFCKKGAGFVVKWDKVKEYIHCKL